MGHAVAGYPAQYVMEKCFAAAGLDCRYLTLDVAPENLGDAVRGMQAMGFRGGHFTAPHKAAVIQHLPQLTDEARLAGLANFVYRDQEGQYVGDNTDGKSLCQCLQHVLDPSGRNVLLLGAGEMARAIAVALALAGAREVNIVNRSVEHGQQLADLLNEQAQVAAMFFPWSGDCEVPAETDIVVNATSVESADPQARVALEIQSLSPQMVVADIVFNPPRTRLLQEAAEQGCSTIDGLQLLVQQGVIAFKTWTGVEPDANVMREALEEYLEL
ncbi:MAG: shikimate dehydrogenase [Planctomycetales bacterium]|nr:shikimate dehydrogenase [Planctomycetales bacterium]NIM09937.1 shikimate dehydrogenase [Planctomycetales bacterium]NIN09377.1 shikimate dehydrogenase [Planctomycetales bacterium]NIN78484.1 shikimate dehydrogenase [Planctomycetales bacterium]NIO35676.1 shikimate dehydrogenase [Planctomycetales bacterium]